jgi:hypothetical protein
MCEHKCWKNILKGVRGHQECYSQFFGKYKFVIRAVSEFQETVKSSPWRMEVIFCGSLGSALKSVRQKELKDIVLFLVPPQKSLRVLNVLKSILKRATEPAPPFHVKAQCAIDIYIWEAPIWYFTML